MQEWINRPFYHRIIERLFSCLVHYSNFHSKYKRAYIVRPFFSRLCLTFFTINTKATKTTAVVTNPAKPDSVKAYSM